MPYVAHAPLNALSRAGTLGAAIAPRLDLLRSVGPGYAWREQRRRRASSRQGGDGRRSGYLELWSQAARQLGAHVTDLSGGFVRIDDGQGAVVVWNHWVPLDDIVTLKLALRKPLVHRMLVEEELPVPDHLVFGVNDLRPALRFLSDRGGPCVIKPIDREGGAATTGAVRTSDHVRRAALRARRLSHQLMIERQVEGENYRLLFLDGELLDAVRRLRPQVIGDGTSSVRDLILTENDRRHSTGAADWYFVCDLDAILTLEEQGLSLRSVPGAGEPVVVKTVINLNGPDFNETVRDHLSDALVEEAARAARRLGVRLAGVDLITPDCTEPLSRAGGVILEVNATPGLHYHYDVRNPEDGVDVVLPILKALLTRPGRRKTPTLERLTVAS